MDAAHNGLSGRDLFVIGFVALLACNILLREGLICELLIALSVRTGRSGRGRGSARRAGTRARRAAGGSGGRPCRRLAVRVRAGSSDRRRRARRQPGATSRRWSESDGSK